MYEGAEDEYIEMDTDIETCLARCEEDGRPAGTEQAIRNYFEETKGAKKMYRKTKGIEVNIENGSIKGYAATWIREPDSYGDVIAKGAFEECLEKIRKEGKMLPLLWNHDSYDIWAYIGTVFDLEEDDHGLAFEASFDDTKEAQRARELASTGRVIKFSFAYDVLDQGTVTLEDGREANELRKLNIHEVSLVMYPANPDTGVIEVKSEKSGRRNSKADAEAMRDALGHLSEATSILSSLLADEDGEGSDDDTGAKSEDRDPGNDEERKRFKDLLAKAEQLLKKGEK